MPSTIFRFYRMVEEGSECTSQALFIGILLDRNNNNWGGFTEPWLTYGLYEFDSEETLDKFKDWSWVEGPFDDQNDPDGKFTRVKVEDVEDVDSREEWDPVGLVYQALAALPLVKIQSAEDLKDLVIDPLLLELDERTGSGSGD
jgi:hypothetical protein